MSDIALTVYGQVAPKGSRTLGTRRDGSAFTRPASSREHAWVDAVAKQAMWTRSRVGVPTPPYSVTIVFYLPRPARPAHPYPSRLDVDKLARAVLDGLVRGGLLVDDRHVTELVATKAWAATPEGEACRVTVGSASGQPNAERLAA